MKNCKSQEPQDCNSKEKKCCVRKFIKKIFCCICRKNQNPLVACVNLYGVIGKEGKLSSGINIDNISPLLKRAFATKNIKAVALNINSPGGSPVQSELIYNYIRELSEEKKIPVYTFAQDVAASGGYWLLLSGDEIYAHNSSIIGSIGVIFSSFGFVDLINKIGVSRRVYTEGKNKAILDPFLPEDEENIRILKEAQNDIFLGFKDLVKNRRHSKLTIEDDKIFTGAFWSGKKSLELGLIDGVASMRQKMKEKFGAKTEIIVIGNKKGLIKSFFSEKSSNIANQAVESLFNKAEERIEFNKFGL